MKKMRNRKGSVLIRCIAILVLVTIFGMGLSAVKYLVWDKENDTVSAKLQLSFVGATQGIGPNGDRIRPDIIKRTEVVAQALEETGLDKIYDADKITQHITVKGAYPSNIVNQVQKYDSVLDFSAIRSVADSNVFPTQLTVIIDNGFDSAIEKEKLVELLKNLISAYRQYLIQHYYFSLDFDSLMQCYNINEYDYPQMLDVIALEMNMLYEYSKEMTEIAPLFRLNEHGFSDICFEIEDLLNNEHSRLVAETTIQSISKDPKRMLMLYRNEARKLQNQVDAYKENLKDYNTLIGKINKDEILYIGTSNSVTKISGKSSNTYDVLVNQKTEITESIALTNAMITQNSHKIQSIEEKENNTSAELVTLLDQRIQELIEKEKQIIARFGNMLNCYVQEECESERTLSVLSLQYNGRTLFSVGYVKEAIKCTAPLVAVFLVVLSACMFVSKRKELVD